MAVRGRKPTATVIKLARGNPGKRPLPQAEPLSTGAPVKPKGLRGAAAVLWDQYVATAFWLRYHDGPAAALWCRLAAEADKSTATMPSARIAQLRALKSELGFDPPSRARLGHNAEKPQGDDPSDKYF